MEVTQGIAQCYDVIESLKEDLIHSISWEKLTALPLEEKFSTFSKPLVNVPTQFPHFDMLDEEKRIEWEDESSLAIAYLIRGVFGGKLKELLNYLTYSMVGIRAQLMTLEKRTRLFDVCSADQAVRLTDEDKIITSQVISSIQSSMKDKVSKEISSVIQNQFEETQRAIEANISKKIPLYGQSTTAEDSKKSEPKIVIVKKQVKMKKLYRKLETWMKKNQKTENSLEHSRRISESYNNNSTLKPKINKNFSDDNSIKNLINNSNIIEGSENVLEVSGKINKINNKINKKFRMNSMQRKEMYAYMAESEGLNPKMKIRDAWEILKAEENLSDWQVYGTTLSTCSICNHKGHSTKYHEKIKNIKPSQEKNMIQIRDSEDSRNSNQEAQEVWEEEEMDSEEDIKRKKKKKKKIIK